MRSIKYFVNNIKYYATQLKMWAQNKEQLEIKEIKYINLSITILAKYKWHCVKY